MSELLREIHYFIIYHHHHHHHHLNGFKLLLPFDMEFVDVIR